MVQTPRHTKNSAIKGDTIVLLHGFISSSNYWKKLQPFLADMGYRVVTIDLLGFGEAPKPAVSYDYPDHIRHVEASVATAGINSRFIIVGHSMGALIAMRFARLHPQKVKSAILIHPPLYRDREEVRRTLRSSGAFYRLLLDSSLRTIMWPVIKLLAFSHIGKHTRAAREGSLENVIEAAEAIKDLEAISVRTLLIIGRKDRPIYMKNLSHMNVSRQVEVRIPDVGHHSPRSNPAVVWREMGGFLEKERGR